MPEAQKRNHNGERNKTAKDYWHQGFIVGSKMIAGQKIEVVRFVSIATADRMIARAAENGFRLVAFLDDETGHYYVTKGR